jgi:hypothetical protein
LCSWMFWFAEPQCHDGLDNLQFLLLNSTFHDFKVCCGSTWILFKSVLKSQNNECIEYNVEHGNSIQKHILRVYYIMEYSNLETMNASSIRWSMVASKLEHGRPCCNLLDALVFSNLANQCPSWGKSPWLATTSTPHSSLPCQCLPIALLLPFHHVPLSCMQLLSCQACHSLPSISSLAPHTHHISCSCVLHQQLGHNYAADFARMNQCWWSWKKWVEFLSGLMCTVITQMFVCSWYHR